MSSGSGTPASYPLGVDPAAAASHLQTPQSSSPPPREALQCTHVNAVTDLSESEATSKQLCDVCDHPGPNLWLCLHRECNRFVGCGENGADHSTKHFRDFPDHAITLNLTTFRVWCYLCETEIFLEDYFPHSQSLSASSRSIRQRKISTSAASVSAGSHMSTSLDRGIGSGHFHNPIYSERVYVAQHSGDSSDEDDDAKSYTSVSSRGGKPSKASEKRPRGLVGLQNLGNTCYMNAALQALSNCEPLTRFILECDSFIRKPGLARSYMRLVREMWDPRRPPYVVPNMISHGIKNVCPVFRGYAQQDAQEFLRCFLDQLHEDLKEPKQDTDDELVKEEAVMDGEQHVMHFNQRQRLRQASAERNQIERAHSDRMSGNSDNEYETCDSGLSSDKSANAEDDITLSSEVQQQNGTTIGLNGDCECDTDVTMKEEEVKQADELDGKVSDAEQAEDNDNNEVDEKIPLKSATLSVGSRRSATPPSNHAMKRPHSGSDYQTVNSSSGISSQNQSKNNSHSSPLHKIGSGHIRGPSFGGASGSDASCTQPDSTSNTSLTTNSSAGSSSSNSCNKKSDSFRSVICDIFDGKILSSVQCLTCDNVSTTRETFQDLSLPIPGRDHLHVLRAAAQQQQQGLGSQSQSRESSASSGLGSHHGSSHQLINQKGDSGAGPASGNSSPTPASHTGSLGPLSPSTSMLSLSTVTSLGSVVLSPVTGAYYWMWVWLNWVMGYMWGPAVTLQDCLSAFFSADELKGDNMYSCEKCKKLRNGVKFCRVVKLPEILCIHLKRFRHELMYSSKISSHVAFPLENLDMSPYMVRGHKDEVTTYDLTAVVVHHGTASSGHYTAYALNYMNETWYEFDDQYVTSVDPQQVANCEAYVLFYRKSSPEAIRRRNRVVDLMKLSKSEPSMFQYYVSKQWVNRFNTFADCTGIGPISNHDFLCPHSAVHPDKSASVHDMCTVFSRSVWEYLLTSFGGGPACNKLYICSTCEEAKQALERRRKTEYETITRLNHEFAANHFASNVHCISTVWFQKWENFVRGKSDEPPGEIDNSSICLSWRNGTFLRVGSDYASISQEMWSFLQATYGGGPALTQG